MFKLRLMEPFSSLDHLILRFPNDLLSATALCQLIKSLIETIGRYEIRLRDLDALVDGTKIAHYTRILGARNWRLSRYLVYLHQYPYTFVERFYLHMLLPKRPYGTFS